MVLHQALYWVNIQQYSDKTDVHGNMRTETAAVPLILPHELFAFIISKGKEEKLLAASHAAKYWSHCRQHTCPWGNNGYVDSRSSV